MIRIAFFQLPALRLCCLALALVFVASTSSAWSQEPDSGDETPPAETEKGESEAESDNADSDAESDASDDSAETETPDDDSDSDADSDADTDSDMKDKPTGPITVIRGGRAITQTADGEIADCVIVLQGDQIIAIGDSSTDIPADANVIDASGYTITPGLIDARSQYGLSSSERQSIADGSTIALDGFDVYTDDTDALLAGGVTSVYIQPTNAALFGGVGSLVAVAPATSIDQITIAENSGAQAALVNGSNNVRVHYAEFGRLSKTLSAIESYKKKWDEYNEYQEKQKKDDDSTPKKTESKSAKKDASDKKSAKKSEKPDSKESDEDKPDEDKPAPKKKSADTDSKDKSKKTETKKPDGKKGDGKKGDGKPSNGKKGDDKEKAPEKPKFNAVYDRLTAIIDGTLPLHVEVHSANDAANALKLIESFEDIQLVFEGLSDTRSTATEIRDSRQPIVLGPWIDADSTGLDASYRVNHWASEYLDHEGLLVIATFGNSPRSSASLREHAAIALTAGLEPSQALSAITINPARLAGADKSTGSLAVGMRADLAVFAGPPLASTTPVAMTIVAGEILYDATESLSSSEAPQAGWIAASIGTQLPDRLPKNYALKSTRVWTVESQWEERLIVVRDGVIESIETPDTELPTELSVFDLGDTVVTPGFISAHTLLGSSRELSLQSNANAANLVARDAFNPQSDRARVLADGGFLWALFAPPSDSTLSGSAAIISLLDGMVAPPPTVNSETSPETAMLPKIALISSARTTNQYPSSLAGQIDVIESAITERETSDRLYVPGQVRKQLRQQRISAFVDAVKSQQPVLIQVSNGAEIDAALDIIKRHKLNASLLFPEDFGPYIDRIAELECGIIVRPHRPGDYAWFIADCTAAIKKGIPVSIAGDSPIDIRWTISELITHGLSSSQAMKMLTTGPASQTVQSIAANQTANLVLWSGDPLLLSSIPIAIVGSGQSVEQLPATEKLKTIIREKQSDESSSSDSQPQSMAVTEPQ